MYGTVIRGQIERTNRNLLVCNVILILLILAYGIIVMALTGQNMFFVMVGGTRSAGNSPSLKADEPKAPVDMSHPTAITVKDLASEDRMEKLKDKAVKLTDDKNVDIVFPVWNSTQRAGGKIIIPPPNYRLSKVGSNFFVILPPDTKTWPTYTGVLRPLAKDDESTVKNVLGSRGVRQVSLMPMMLDCLTGSAPAAAKGVPGPPFGPQGVHIPAFPAPNMFLILLGALPVWNIVKALKRGKNPSSHPVIQRLATYGPPEEVVKAIDAEAVRGITKIAPAQFTFSWLLVPTLFTINVIHLDHIVWVYQRVYVTKGRTFAVVVRDRQGGYHEFICGMFQVNKIIEYITKARPWIVAGYDSRTNSEYTGNRANFIAHMDAQRQRYLSQQPPSP